ncbi:MAG TPA: type II toxin-antitoxin system death-on-curing family toxin [Candidatus Colwellbacteria bacterium]|nr:type II toxin-antitoxin system death-on-curing family toxin [Candidatus Colwellbacteria bacterium]HQA95788.1 type II toxin-antitoxin system death-on-curing family toxin [Candidatus Colwellbacteria bacterium]
MKSKSITLIEVENVAYTLARELMTYNEPIPEFNSRFPNILESCLAVPFQTFDKKLVYKGLIGKASILFYLLIKNHPFQNGNKRIAITTLMVFLYINNKWIEVDNQEFYNFAKWVAASNPKVKEATVAAIEKFLETYIVKLVN